MGNRPEGSARIEKEQDLGYEPHSYDQQTTSVTHSGASRAATALLALNFARGGAMRRSWKTPEARIVYEWAS
ncbi:MAG: hypothetical protein L0338_38335, partial [Acidobacteria bacterium]|nr:hypothetical protein [Acidobacteriota bacterium]